MDLASLWPEPHEVTSQADSFSCSLMTSYKICERNSVELCLVTITYDNTQDNYMWLMGWSGPHIMMGEGGDGEEKNIGDLDYQIKKTI